MRAPAMIIVEIADQYSFQMAIVQHNDMIQAIPPNAANNEIQAVGIFGKDSIL